MANTTIALRQSGATGNTPSLGVLANGELSINYADGIIYYKTSSNTLGSIRTTQPAGLTKEVQFNDAGSFGTDSDFTYDKTNNRLNVENVIVNTAITIGSATGGTLTGANVIYSNTFVANSTATSTSTTTGAIVVGGGLGVAGNVYAGNINVASRVDWAPVNYAPPGFTTRSSGTKLNLYPAISGSTVDYAIGIDGATLWSSVPQATNSYFFKWYGGETNIASLDGTGKLTTVTANIVSSTASTSNATGTLTVGGGVGVKGNVYADAVYSGGSAVATIGDILAISIALG